MRLAVFLPMGLATLMLAASAPAAGANAADCSQGSSDEKIACLATAVGALQAKLDTLTQQLDQKAAKTDLDAKANDSEAVKWGDWLILRNQDMRIYPRCLDNPGPDSPDLTTVSANSCAPAAGQTWNIARPRG